MNTSGTSPAEDPARSLQLDPIFAFGGDAGCLGRLCDVGGPHGGGGRGTISLRKVENLQHHLQLCSVAEMESRAQKLRRATLMQRVITNIGTRIRDVEKSQSQQPLDADLVAPMTAARSTFLNTWKEGIKRPRVLCGVGGRDDDCSRSLHTGFSSTKIGVGVQDKTAHMGWTEQEDTIIMHHVKFCVESNTPIPWNHLALNIRVRRACCEVMLCICSQQIHLISRGCRMNHDRS